ncbi:MAG: hypothetical protein WBG43_00520 [Marinifilaceae bacterium]
MIKKYSSNYVFSPDKGIMSFGIVVVEDATVTDIIDINGEIREIAGLEFYSGYLIIGDIEKDCFNNLRVNNASFEQLFTEVKTSYRSLLHIDKLDFQARRLQSNTVLKKIL